MSIFINVTNQKMTLTSPLCNNIIEGSQNFVKFEFIFDNDWDSLTTFAQFTQNGVGYNVYLNNNSVYLPTEIVAGKFTMMLYGTGGPGGTIHATTNVLRFTVDENELIADAQSTEITQSLYDQLVNMIGQFLDLNQTEYGEIILERVNELIAGYVEDGTLVAATIEDGSISRAKVNSAFETTLGKADTAMQPSIYDTHGYGEAAASRGDTFDIFDYVLARKAEITNNAGTGVHDVLDAEVKAARSNSTRQTAYSSLAEAIEAIYTSAKGYTNVALTNYSPFFVEIVDELPTVGADRTFYLVLKDSGNGYDKWWYITDDNGQKQWDCFGSTSTMVVNSLPQIGDVDTDYIVSIGGTYMYYKWINNTWELIAGSSASVVSELPTTGNETTDYYVPNASGVYLHYRYINGEWEIIGSDAYSKDEVDALLNSLSAGVTSSINTQNGRINAIDAAVTALGNLVADVSATSTGILVTYKDGSTRAITTKDDTVVVEDVTRTSDGIQIVYTDGSTNNIEISGGGGSGSTSGSASISRVTSAATQCVYGNACNIIYTFTAIDSAGDAVGNGTATWYVGNVRKATSVAAQGSNTFDIGPYLSAGANNVKLSISVDTGGDTNTVVTKTWTVNAVNMYLTWDYDDTTINEGETFTLRWTPYGDLSKTTHIIIDGTEYDTSVTTRSGVQQYMIIDKLAHGSHLITLYLTATVGSSLITSDAVSHDMIFVDSSTSTPIISCPIQSTSMVQYNTLALPVVVYTPGNLTSDVILRVNGAQIATWDDIDRSVHYWNYTPTTAGTKTLTIQSGAATKTITIVVSELDIDNEEVPGYAMRMKASDLASNEALQAWTNNGYSVSFSNNFDWNNGGIQTELDDDGFVRQFVCVKAGTSMTINYPLFGNDAKANGKSFKIIFKTVNSRDYDAVFMDCIADNIGIQLGANGGTVRSEQNTVDVHYAEDTYTEFEFDVYPSSTFHYIQTFIDGVLSSANVYASSDNFQQTNVKNIVIGSSDCDTYIYMIKVYEANLTLNNHISNFIADAPNATEMVSRFNRNDILNESGEIDYEKLATQNKNCRVHLFDVPRMPQDKIKKDPVSGCSYQQIYNAGDAGDQITAENVTIGIQGTSSVNYKDAGMNTDAQFNDGFTDGNGNHLNGYSMTDDSIPVNYFNLKVNIASCENINNMCLAEWYNRFQPYMSGARQNVANARDCMEHHIGVEFIKDQSHTLFPDDEYHMYAICNMGNSKNNSSVFHDEDNALECCFETKDNNSPICMMTDTINQTQLDSEDYFEFRYPVDKSKRTQAMKTAFINFVNWMASRNPAAATNNALSSPVTFEPYTFRGTGQDGEVLAGLTISDYAGTYTTDSYNYRMARLLSECEDHLIMDSIVYHYVFVEQHAMVDNVCKNTFWGTDDLVHWQLCKNYDNDTADGNNNTGHLTIPFGSEGMDTLGSGDVFNGKMSVYWQLVFGIYDARRRMWQNREAAGAWNAEAYLAFATGWQDYIPERVYNQDYWYKYLRLYETSQIDTYISMLEGGKKTHQRASFVMNNLWYMASQYEGTAAASRAITLRAYTPSAWAGVEPASQVRVMLYNKGYITVKIGEVTKRVKSEKAVMNTITFNDAGSMNDTVIQILSGNNIRAIGDISCLYIGYSDFSYATKLRSLTIGSMATGYSNANLTSIGFGTNPMLEELYIQNCPNATQTLDLKGCQALTTLDVRGSGFTGIEFALGGLLETAKLCSPSSITMRNLHYLTSTNFSMESYNNLTTLFVENCSGLNILSIINAASHLNRARIVGIAWTFTDTSTLDYLLTLIGLDENNHNTETSVVTGTAYVPTMRQSKLMRYNAAWPNLTVTYDTMVTQYLATFLNADGTPIYDKNGNAYTQWVDAGSEPYDPVTMGYTITLHASGVPDDSEYAASSYSGVYYQNTSNGDIYLSDGTDWNFVVTSDILTPTMASTAQYVYTYSGWSNLSGVMITSRNVTAQYTATIRTYTVTWYKYPGLVLETQTGVNYGAEANYSGDTPTWTDDEGSFNFRVFKGWDKSTGRVTGDINVYAVWDTTNTLPATGTDLSNMTPVQVYAVAASGNASTYFSAKDYIDIELGHDFDFSNVDSQILASNQYFNGATAVDTDIQLFGEHEKSFTIAIDLRFTSTDTDNTLLSCYEEDGAEGFRVRYNGGTPMIQWGDQNIAVGYQKYRDIIVLRHIKGENKLYVYASNTTGTGSNFSNGIARIESTRSRATSTDAVLSLGAIRFAGDGGHDDYGTGMVYWCKIWFDDLGDTNARALAAWCHETIRMEYYGAEKYRLAGNTSQKVNASFVANNLLGDRGYQMNTTNTNAGGWDSSLMRTFCNNRLKAALPTVWQSMIKKAKISATAGSQSSLIVVSEDYIYLPCTNEVGGGQSAPYTSEGEAMGWYTSNILRAKFRGRIIPDDASHYTDASDPQTISTYTVKVGDVWQPNGGSNTNYIFVSKTEIDRFGLTVYGTATNAGGWVAAYNWWLRSPGVGGSTYFWTVNGGGGVYGFGTNGNASYSAGVCPCFSI